MFSKKRPSHLILFFILSAFLFSCGSDDNSGTGDDGPGTPDFLGEVLWVKTFGGSGDEDAVSVVQSNDGNYVVLSSTKSIDGDITGKTTTDLDFWLLKIDVNGEKIWDKTYGGSLQDKARSISKTTDGGFILSGFTASTDGDITENAGFHDYWIIKVNANGDIQWQKTYGFIGQDQAYKVIQTSDGGYLATGFLDVGASEGQGNDLIDPNNTDRNTLHSLGDFWAIRMDANGNKIWRRYFGGTHVEQGKDVLETEDGGFLLVGNSESSDFDVSNAHGSHDFWAIKINANGDKLWENTFGGLQSDFAFAVTNTSDGNFILVGDTRSSDADVSNPLGNADAWVVKFSGANGNLIWEKTYGGLEFDSARGIIKLENNNYAIAANTRSNNNDVSNHYGSNDAWVLIIDENGLLEFEKNIGGTDLDFANGLTETTNNELIFVGNTDSDDIDIIINKGSKDILVFKMK